MSKAIRKIVCLRGLLAFCLDLHSDPSNVHPLSYTCFSDIPEDEWKLLSQVEFDTKVK
jgi:hypothetical protein